MRPQLYLLVLFLLSTVTISAQKNDPLPHQMTPAEQLAFPAFLQESLQPASAKGLLVAPPDNVRTMAEWEEVEALMITWAQYPTILIEITRHAVEECRVIIVTTNENSVITQLTNAGVPLDNVEFLSESFNSIWIRDYGPWAVYLNDVDSLAIADYVYNRPSRIADDQIPYHTADLFNVPIYAADEVPDRWVHTGGNHLRDGLYTAWSSDLVLTENPGFSGREINKYAETYLGVKDYRLLRYLPYDDIHHLDMHMRTLDEETIAIGEYPAGIADGPQIEANIEFIRNHYRTPYGRPYKIIRQQMPPENNAYPPVGDYRTYCNGIFINKTLLVPVYEEEFDTTALQIYRNYLPGYNVVGINCNEMISALGALHCITKLIGVERPLWIAHPRLRDTYDAENDYLVEAQIKHVSGIASATLHYRWVGESDYIAVEMTQISIEDGQWQAYIPAQAAGIEIQYYIQAEANDGKTQVRPIPAPEGYYFFNVKAIEELPVAQWLQKSKLAPQGSTILFTDDSENGVLTSEWTFSGGDLVQSDGLDQWVNYPNHGSFDVNLNVSNTLGGSNKIETDAVVIPEALDLFTEDFTGGITDRWMIENEDGDAAQWAFSEDGGCDGACLMVNNFSTANEYTREYLRTSVALPEATNVNMNFDVSYAARNTHLVRRWDELRVNIIDQNGDITNVYNKGKFVLATVNNNSQPYTPTSCNQWRTETADLSDWAGQNIIIEFESIGQNGNNLYLDNISFEVNMVPLVAITSPEDGICYGGVMDAFEEPVVLTASDPDGEIAAIALYLNGNLEETLTDAPYETSVTIDGIGFFCFKAKATDEQGAETWSEEVCIETKLDDVGLFEVTALALDMQLSPNPVTDLAQLLIASEENLGLTSLQILSSDGKLITHNQLDIPIGKQQQTLNLQPLTAGIYFLRLANGKGSKVISFVKQ